MHPMLIAICVATYSILVVASLITYVVLKKNPAHVTFQKVAVIVKSWWLIVSFLVLCFALAPLGLFLGFALISFLGAREYLAHSSLASFKRSLLAIISIFIMAQYLALYFLRFDLFQILPLLFILTFFPPLVIFSGQTQSLPLLFSSFAGPIIFFYCLGHIPALYVLGMQGWKNESQALIAVFAIIFLTEMNDILQFIFGKALGHRKLFPLISPNKTLAGFIFGTMGTTALGALIFNLACGVNLLEASLMGFVLACFGISGDLFFSSIKRFLGTKDFSNALPGHGGYLDRLDSLFLTAPILFYLFWYFRGGFQTILGG